ncbi:MAG: bifunctional phosphopantothenoylcysteine decarboxylase/phosphopantothenate--cysteine ligase CoaBC [Christensenellaceae bacterium]|jgi:phosphopantothenoylcysteine decarboxylase/phosphopantothenate--cysteine ligase|nr:bifunctional phosphopantothenoylcysteine decarboxylase/phosphopantothenate--cysteine ligase CoaBC [Christensenellaceae bacterium]
MKKPCVVLGVTGGIAAYRAPDIARRLIKAGCEVFCILTKSAQNIITKQTMETMSKNPCVVDMFESPKSWEVEHIALATRADLFLIAPATANLIAKMAAGIADDMLTTTVLATKASVLVVPAMNTNMYENPITQRNIAALAALGVRFMEPTEGMLANGHIGKGHIPEVDEIVRRALDELDAGAPNSDLKGLKVLVTAGPTREAIDPVRYITNRSSGKMGYAVAAEAARRGAEVVLVSGPVALEKPEGVERVFVQSTLDLFNEMTSRCEGADLIIQSAAPADFRPLTVAETKIKKLGGDGMTLELTQNPDVAASVGKLKKEGQVIVGFAAETDHIGENARAKLLRKNADFIVANDVTRPGAGFDVDTNIASIVTAEGVEELPLMQKSELAAWILDRALAVRKAKAEEA